jgi:hypothetical protein
MSRSQLCCMFDRPMIGSVLSCNNSNDSKESPDPIPEKFLTPVSYRTCCDSTESANNDHREFRRFLLHHFRLHYWKCQCVKGCQFDSIKL